MFYLSGSNVVDPLLKVTCFHENCLPYVLAGAVG